MTHHSIQRTATGTVTKITGTCDSDECPTEHVDDDGGIEYVCPATGDVITTVDPVDTPDTPDDRTPATVDSLTNHRRRRRR